jgi:hypothetical protein
VAEASGVGVSAVTDNLGTALVTRWSALGPLQALDDRGVRVVRGAPIGGIGPGKWVLVEFDGSPDARENARWQRDWLDLACTRQRELGEVTCSVVAQTGAADIDVMQTAAAAMLDACVADLRSDLTVGGILWSQQVTQGSAHQLKNEAGVAVLIPFTVAYAAQV